MKKILQQIFPEIVNIRHQIHSNPELAHEEHATASLVSDVLIKYGYDVTQHISGTGVSAILDSGKLGKTVALRADMDALPIQEDTTLSYQSKNTGKMHACGHDGHTATLLAAACALAQCKNQFKGKIKFIFQPAEETGTGAAAMIKAGILDNPKVDAIFGYHNTPKSEAGVFRTKSGCIHASQDVFTITVHGRGGHGAQPQLTIDPIYIGSLIIQAMQGIVSRLISPTEPVVVSVTQFHAGTTHNVIPDEATINGTIRAVNAEIRCMVKQKLKDIATDLATAFGATAKIDFSYCFPPTMNSPIETQLAYKTAQHILGDDKAFILSDPGMASEDFSYYLEQIPGCFFWVGTGFKDLNVHNSHYEFNDAIIPIASEVLAKIAINYLNSSDFSYPLQK